MDTNPPPIPSGLASDDKLTPVMIYTETSLIRGQAVTKENVRVNIWLRTQGAPEFIHLKNAQVISYTGPGPLQPVTFIDYFLPTGQVLGFHTLPPANETLDYDETEKNRKMEPISALIGNFRVAAHMRMSSLMNLGTNLEVSRIVFLSLYDVEITNPYIPGMGVVKAPMMLVRMSHVSYGNR